MTTEYELEVQRTITAEYIATDVTSVVFNVRTSEPDGEGGSTWLESGPLDPQDIRVITNSATRSGSSQRTVDGVLVTPDLTLLCLWDVNVVAGYTCTIEGDDYEVIYVSRDLRYETTAEVLRR